MIESSPGRTSEKPVAGQGLRVLVLAPWGEALGGAEMMLQGVLAHSRTLGHEMELVFLERGPWPADLLRAGFAVEVIDGGRLRDPLRFVRTVGRLAQIMRARRPDLILDWAAKTHLYGAPAATLAGMNDRLIWWQQGIPDGNWIDRLATALPTSAVGCYSQAAARAQARLRPRRSTFVVSACAPAATRQGSAGPDGSPDNGPSTPLRETERWERPLDGVPVVGLVGRLQPWKGQDRLLRAQAILRERGQRMHLVLVGGDAYKLSPEYASSLPALVHRLGLRGEVTLTGQVPDPGPHIERMDILVNASDPEPFGIVLLEAMARGVAVLAVDSGGPSEFIADGHTGALASSGEPEALADALEPLLASPQLRQRLGAAGRERFLHEFTDEVVASRFFGALGEVVASRVAEAPRVVTLVAHDVGSVGGMERQLGELALGLRKRGTGVTVIARTCALPRDAGIEFHRVRGPSKPFLIAYPWFLFAGTLAVRRWRKGILQTTGAIVLNRADCVAVHCCHAAYRAQSKRAGWASALYTRVAGLTARVGERLIFVRNRSASFVGVSDGVTAELREHFPALASRTLTIHNGVDTASFAPGVRPVKAQAMRARLAIPSERLLAAFVGDGNKGLEYLLEALTQAPEWDLLVAGRGETDRYRARALALGLAGSVHWLGVVNDIQVVYESADAFVLPSGYETFSLVTFEAAASGLAILATPVSGVRELISDGQSGIVIDERPATIAAGLRRLGSDPQLRRELGAAARQRACRFSWERMIDAHSELYVHVAEKNANARAGL